MVVNTAALAHIAAALTGSMSGPITLAARVGGGAANVDAMATHWTTSWNKLG
jgi:hypothetical protein